MTARRIPLFLLGLIAFAGSLGAQADFRVYTDHPRLFLEPDRLQRLVRDVERETPRWLRLADLLAAEAPMPEAAVAQALAFRVANDEARGRRAVEQMLLRAKAGTLGDPGVLRQAALVFDWCYELLNDEELTTLAKAMGAQAELQSQLAGTELGRVRDGLLASVALAGDWEGAEPAIGSFLENQWKQDLVPLLQAGELTDYGEDLIALLEISHAVRRNLERDLWRDVPLVFRSLPDVRILQYTDETAETEEGRVRLRVLPETDEPEHEAMLGRIAEMMLVAYDSNARPFQFLQGWLRNDSLTLTGLTGTLYEFLWINPYLPGLSPSSGLLTAHDEVRGRIFARQGWDEDDLWLGYWDGRLRLIAGGELMEVSVSDKQAPLLFPGVSVVLPEMDTKIDVAISEPAMAIFPTIYLVGLKEGRGYNVRVQKQDWRLVTAERGGIVVIRNTAEKDSVKVDFSKKVRVQIRPSLEQPPGRGKPSLLD